MLSLALRVCDSENGSMIPVDDDSVEVIGETRQHLLDHLIDIDKGFVGHVIRAPEAMLVTDLHNSSGWPSAVDQAIGYDKGAPMRAPLFNNEKMYGVSKW